MKSCHLAVVLLVLLHPFFGVLESLEKMSLSSKNYFSVFKRKKVDPKPKVHPYEKKDVFKFMSFNVNGLKSIHKKKVLVKKALEIKSKR